MQIEVPTKKMHVDAQLPKYESENAAGMDLMWCPLVTESFSATIPAHSRMMLKTGIAQAIPVGFEGQIRPRSGNAYKKGLTVLNSPGTIDADYRGEIGVILFNSSDDDITLGAGDKIAQIVYCPVASAEITSVDELPPTVRGTGGFGSTGVVGGS